MKIGAGGLQSQIIEESIKTREIDPVRNKPGHDEAMAANLIAGQKKISKQLTPRPVDKTLKNSELYNQKVNRQGQRQDQKQQEKQKQHNRRTKKVDLYI